MAHRAEGQFLDDPDQPPEARSDDLQFPGRRNLQRLRRADGRVPSELYTKPAPIHAQSWHNRVNKRTGTPAVRVVQQKTVVRQLHFRSAWLLRFGVSTFISVPRC